MTIGGAGPYNRRPVRLEGLEETLSRLTEVGTPVKVRPYRQVWRVEHPPGGGGQAMYLKWYPRRGQFLKRRVRGNPALAEYDRLQRLQLARIPSPRAVAYLAGMMLGGHKGDAVLTAAIEPGELLDDVVRRASAEGRTFTVAERRDLAAQVVGLVSQLAKARLGHRDLHFGNFLRSPPGAGGKLHLLDAYAVEPGALTARHVEQLAFSAGSSATRTDLLRAWRRIGPDGAPLPRIDSRTARRQWRKSVERMCTETDYAGRVDLAGGWRCSYFKRTKITQRWSAASGLTISADDWRREWPRLLQQVESETLYPLKRGASGDVWAGEVVLAGRPVEVVLKRPFRRHAYRYVTELGRGSRAWRAWWKAWALLARNIATAWPLAVFERRVAGVVVDQAVVCERVAGTQLDGIDFEALGHEASSTLLRRVGRLLRRIDDTGIVHFDTKASNILIATGPARGLIPVLVDVDGVRPYSWRGEGLARLQRSMRDHHPAFTEALAAELSAGYSPFAKGGVK